MNPLISIIIPTYNRAQLIGETLDSISAQTYTNWECIVVDDGSTDNTEKVLQHYQQKDPRFQFYKRPHSKPKGANSCRNYGFELSKGDYINWFDSDDLMHKDFLILKIEKAIEGNYNFVSCELGKFNSKNKVEKLKYNYNKNIFENYFCGELAFYTPGPLWKKKFLLKKNLKFDKKSKVLNDWIFSLEALFVTNNYFLLKKKLCYYRVHETSISSGLEGINNELIFSEFKVRIDFYKKYSDKNLLTKKIRDFYFKRLVFLLRSLLIVKDKKAVVVYIYIMKLKFHSFSKLKITLGFISFKIFNKGYLFFK